MRWSHVIALGYACSDLLFDTDMTGFQYIKRCWELNPGLLEHDMVCNNIAHTYAHKILEFANFQNEVSEICTPCWEACSVTLVLSTLRTSYANTQECTESFMYFLYAIHLLIIKGSRDELFDVVNRYIVNDYYDQRKKNCGAQRVKEMNMRFGGFKLAKQLERHQRKQKNRSAIIMAVSNAQEILKTYQPFINLWRCYSLRHGYEFLLDTDDYEIIAHFRSPNWMRWLTAQKYLEFYDEILIVDPDAYVAPSCWDEDVVTIARNTSKSTGAPVVYRLFTLPQTLNNGVVYLRNTPMGHYFLTLLLDKLGWWQTHAQDQGAFDETILEMLGMERGLVDGTNTCEYYSECLPLVFPVHDRSHATSFFTLCWYEEFNRLLDEGNRTSKVIGFVDPRMADINHVVGWRSLSQKALIYHFAGGGKNYADVLEAFGMEKSDTGQCTLVYEYVDKEFEQHGCTKYNEGVVDARTYCNPPVVVC